MLLYKCKQRKQKEKENKKMKAYIKEKTKEEVERLRDKFLKSGQITYAGKVEKYVYCINRKTREPIYHYQCECE